MYFFKHCSSFGGEGSLTSLAEEMFSQSPFVAPGVWLWIPSHNGGRLQTREDLTLPGIASLRPFFW